MQDADEVSFLFIRQFALDDLGEKKMTDEAMVLNSKRFSFIFM